MEILKAILFGIVEGITEWLPVSSTGHMILLNEFLPLRVGQTKEEMDAFYSMFEVVIQLGAILAVVLVFWTRLWPFGRKNNQKPLADHGIGSYIKWDIFELWFHILISCVPAAVIGILFDEQLEKWFYNYQTVAIMLILFGIAFLVVETYNKDKKPKIRKVSDITYTTALLIGLFQVIAAVFPGTSRSGATIVGALLIGVARRAAAEYTFYLAVPVMFGASLLKLVKHGLSFSPMQLAVLLVGMVVAFVVSLAVIRFLLGYIRKHDFKPFGWYRIALGAIVLVCGLAGVIGG